MLYVALPPMIQFCTDLLWFLIKCAIAAKFDEHTEGTASAICQVKIRCSEALLCSAPLIVESIGIRNMFAKVSGDFPQL